MCELPRMHLPLFTYSAASRVRHRRTASHRRTPRSDRPPLTSSELHVDYEALRLLTRKWHGILGYLEVIHELVAAATDATVDRLVALARRVDRPGWLVRDPRMFLDFFDAEARGIVDGEHAVEEGLESGRKVVKVLLPVRLEGALANADTRALIRSKLFEPPVSVLGLFDGEKARHEREGHDPHRPHVKLERRVVWLVVHFRRSVRSRARHVGDGPLDHVAVLANLGGPGQGGRVSTTRVRGGGHSWRGEDD